MSTQEPTGRPAPETGPAPAVLRVTIIDDDPAAVLAGGVYAVLRDNGYAVAEVEPGGLEDDGRNWTDTWPMWARQLDALLTEVAAAERAATVAHAEAYLAAEGTQQYRAASAELAAAAAVETHAKLAGRAEAFRLILAGQAGRDAHNAARVAGPAWPRPPEPGPEDPPYRGSV